MIVREIMTTKLVTLNHDDTLSHAANLFRQYQFHHLPVVRIVKHRKNDVNQALYQTQMYFEGMITTQDIDLAAVLAKQSASTDILHHSWQEQHVSEVMHRASVRITPTSGIATAAQIMVERDLSVLPVVEYEYMEQETNVILVGLLTRSGLLTVLARSLGVNEPGMELVVQLPMGDMAPLAHTLLLVKEMHIQVHSIIAAPLVGSVPHMVTLRLGTINPAPLLVRLQKAAIQYTFAEPLVEEEDHD